MAQTIEKQQFCNIYTDLKIDLDSLVSQKLKQGQLEEVASKSQNNISNQLAKFVRKSKYNSNYMNETYMVSNYKSNIDRKNFFKVPVAL